MEGLNVGAILAGYLAVFAFGVTSLVALGLQVAGRARAARVLFAAGLLGGTLLMAAAMLSFFEPVFRDDASPALIGITAVSLSMAGAGQFAAAFRGGRALACAAAALALTASPLLIGDWGAEILGGLGAWLTARNVPFLVAAGLLPAAAGVVIGPWSACRRPPLRAGRTRLEPVEGV